MNIQQELDSTRRDLEAAKQNLKSVNDTHQRAKMESKIHWLEDKLQKLNRKTQS